jgi:hypothetical protein
MRYAREEGAKPPSFDPGPGALAAVMVATIVTLVPLVPALAHDPKSGASFAHAYFPSYAGTVAPASLELKLFAPSFKKLVETNTSVLPGSAQHAVPGGIHQGNIAVMVGLAALQPVRFEYRPGDRIILHVGDRTVDTGLQAAQARPMASFVANRSNGLVSLNDVAVCDGKVVYRPKVAGSYIDTEEGYWLLWADAIAADSFLRVTGKDAADGLTIVDSEKPVTINTDGGLDVRGGEPRVALLKRLGGNRVTILDHKAFDIINARDQDDLKALATVRGVFKWAPVMRLAAENDSVEFKTFIQQLESIRIASVPTPCRLEARFYR